MTTLRYNWLHVLLCNCITYHRRMSHHKCNPWYSVVQTAVIVDCPLFQLELDAIALLRFLCCTHLHGKVMFTINTDVFFHYKTKYSQKGVNFHTIIVLVFFRFFLGGGGLRKCKPLWNYVCIFENAIIDLLISFLK